MLFFAVFADYQLIQHQWQIIVHSVSGQVVQYLRSTSKKTLPVHFFVTFVLYLLNNAEYKIATTIYQCLIDLNVSCSITKINRTSIKGEIHKDSDI